MSKVQIKYSELESAASEAKNAAEQLKSYSRDLTAAIKNMNDAPGADSSGYVSSALNLARKKRAAADSEITRYTQFSDSLTTFKDFAKKQDANGKNAICRTVSDYVGERSVWQKIGDAFHDMYVGFLDRCESFGPVGKFIAQGIRRIKDFGGAVGVAFSDVRNWFKYKEGKYVLNILDAIKDIILGVGIAVAAVAAAVVTGPVWLLVVGLVGIAAGSTYMLLQARDSSAAIEENAKALGLYNGSPSVARFYGNTKGEADRARHYDYGSEEDNIRVEKRENIIKTTKDVSKVVTTVCTIGLGVASNGLETAANGKQTVNFKKGILNTFKKDLGKAGFSSGNQGSSVNLKEALNPGKVIIKNNMAKDLETVYGVGKAPAMMSGIAKVHDVTKTLGTMHDVGSGINSLVQGDASGYGAVKSGMNVVTSIPVVDAGLGKTWKIVKYLHNIDFSGYQTPSERLAAYSRN